MLPDGRKVAGIAELKQALLAKEEQVARNLTEKMLTFACGRLLGPRDRGEVDRILDGLRPNGFRLRDLVHGVAGSRLVTGEGSGR